MPLTVDDGHDATRRQTAAAAAASAASAGRPMSAVLRVVWCAGGVNCDVNAKETGLSADRELFGDDEPIRQGSSEQSSNRHGGETATSAMADG